MALTQAELEQAAKLILQVYSHQTNNTLTNPENQLVNHSQPAALSVLPIETLSIEPVSSDYENSNVVEIPSEPILSEWLTMYEHNLTVKAYKAQTIKNKLSVLAHIRRMWGNIKMGSLKPYRIMSDMKESFLPDKTSTAVRILSELKTVYAEAVANGWAATNPVMYIKPIKHQTIRQRLSLEVWKRMLELSERHPQGWVKGMLLLALITGQRRGDLQKMRYTDIVTDEFGNEYLRVEQLKEAGKGYGARVEIPLDLRMNSIGYTVRQVINICTEYGKEGATLLRKSNGDSIEASSLSTRFSELVCVASNDIANLKPRERPSLHEVRSLSARTYASQGVDIQTLLGHKTPEITEIYKNSRGLDALEWKRVKS